MSDGRIQGEAELLIHQAANESARPADGRAGNAWRHGLDARRVTVGDEDLSAFAQLRDALVEQWRPRNVTQWVLVDHLARCQWRLMRAGETETRMVEIAQDYKRLWDGSHLERRGGPVSAVNAMANDLTSPRSGLARVQMFQGRLERSIHRTISLLLTLRKSRGKRGGSRTAAAR